MKVVIIIKSITERIKGRYNEDNTCRFYLNLLLMLVINAIFFIAYIKGIKIYYYINDDTAISGLISGIQGSYPGYAVYINFIPAYIMSKLTIINPNINWYGMYLISTFYVSFSIIGTIIINKMRLKVGLAAYSALIICGMLPFLENFTFTIVCYICVLSAISLFVYAYENRIPKINIFCCILGVLLLINASFIRFNSIYTAIVLLIGYFMIKSIVDKKRAIIIMLIFLMAIGMAFAFKGFSKAQYYKDQEWSDYLEFNLARSNLIDYGLPNYRDHEEFYRSVGWSENDYNIFISYSFPEDEKYSTENLNKIYEYKKSIEDNKIQLRAVFTSIYNNLKTDVSTSMCVILILVIGIFNVIYGKEELLSILLICFPYAMHIGFLLINRAPYRVVYPHYYIALALLIIISYEDNSNEDDCGNVKERERVKNYISTMSLIVFILIGGQILVKHYYNSVDIRNDEYLRRSVEIYETLCNDKENIYLMSLNSNGSIVKGKTIFRGYPPNFKSNVVSIGGWLSRTKNVEQFKRENGISNLVYDLINKGNYYFVDSGNHVGMFYYYFLETYGIEVNFEQVRQMYHTNVYKVSKVEPEVIEEDVESIDNGENTEILGSEEVQEVE